MEFIWVLPVNSSYDNFSITVDIVDTITTRYAIVPKDQTTFLVDNLDPGTTVAIVVSTMKDGLIITNETINISIRKTKKNYFIFLDFE